MATELNQKSLDKLTTLVKKSPGNSEHWYSEQSGIEMSQILRYLIKAELQADPSLKIAPNGKAIAKARGEGIRWPRIAGRTGMSESKCKELFTAETGVDARMSYTGRGRDFSGTQPTKTGSSGRRGAKAAGRPAGTSGRRSGVKVGAPAGRRGAAAAAKPAGRRGTRSSATRTADPK